MKKISQMFTNTPKLLALACALGFFSSAQAAVVFQDDFSDGNRDGWFITNTNATRNLSVNDGRLVLSTGNNTSNFLGYFSSTSIEVGQSIILDFNFTVASDFPSDALRYGLLNSGGSLLEDDVNATGSASTLNGYQGVAAMHTSEAGGIQRLAARAGGSDSLWTTNAGGFNQNLGGAPLTLGITHGDTIYNGQFIVERIDADSLRITSTLNGVSVSRTQTDATNFTFDTIAFHSGPGGLGLTLDNISVSVIPEPSQVALFIALPVLALLFFRRRKS